MANRAAFVAFYLQNKAHFLSRKLLHIPVASRLAARGFANDSGEKETGFWDSIMGTGDSRSGAHSKLLSSEETLYEFQCKSLFILLENLFMQCVVFLGSTLTIGAHFPHTYTVH